MEAIAWRAAVEAFRRQLSAAPEALVTWDMVVVTACDDPQAEVYKAQIAEKQRLGQIPAASKVIVMADLEGPKIGNGGSTLMVLDELQRTTDPSWLDQARILVIHAGGFSKRLPHVSAIGKVFSAMPLGPPLMQMLDLKLIMYCTLPSRMRPGVFVASADDIELFNGLDERVRFDQPGFTALAHPSPIEIGETHGVFCFAAAEAQQCAADMTLSANARQALALPVRRFLHKPKVSVMRQQGAIVDDGKEPFVYTDSAYFFDRATARKLVDVYHTLKPIQCEIDAYGDYLQALGSEADASYTENTANVIAVVNNLVDVRRHLFEKLRGTPLTALVFNNSKFYHIGTTDEYLHHLCDDTVFRRELNCASVVDTVCVQQQRVLQALPNHSEQVVVMGSRLDDSATVCFCAPSVVEYCHVGRKVSIGPRCIVSNASLPDDSVVPANTFVCVYETSAGYVPTVFGIKDDLKRKHASTESVRIGSAHVGQLVGSRPVWPDGVEQSLWEACLFPAFATRQDASTFALQWAAAVAAGSDLHSGDIQRKLYSMAHILTIKDVPRGIADRRSLSSINVT